MPPTLSLNNHYSRRSYCWNPLVCASGAKQYYNLLPSYYLCKGRDERGIHIVIESTVSVSLMERLDQFRMSLGGCRVGLEQGGWTVLMLLVLLVVRFGRGRHCVRLVSFFRSLCVSLFRGRKKVRLTFPPLNQRSHSPTTRMYAPSDDKATLP